jgi:hypothetical protein
MRDFLGGLSGFWPCVLFPLWASGGQDSVASTEPHFGCQRFQLVSHAWSSFACFTIALCSVFSPTVHVVCSTPDRFFCVPPVSRSASGFGSVPPEFLLCWPFTPRSDCPSSVFSSCVLIYFSSTKIHFQQLAQVLSFHVLLVDFG